MVYKHRRIIKNQWKIEENDVDEELDKAAVERPTASSNWYIETRPQYISSHIKIHCFDCLVFETWKCVQIRYM